MAPDRFERHSFGNPAIFGPAEDYRPAPPDFDPRDDPFDRRLSPKSAEKAPGLLGLELDDILLLLVILCVMQNDEPNNTELLFILLFLFISGK